MNREIKFRGKRLDNGEWVYGSLILSKDYKKASIAILDDDYKLFYYGVDPKTVGQYTEVEDKNGKEVYENDILKSIDDGEEGNPYYPMQILVGFVYYNEGGFYVNDGPNGHSPLYDWNDESEIISNTHENPELLEK